MSYLTAISQVAAIVEDTVPPSQGLGVQDRFKHDVKGNESRMGGPGRRFWFAATTSLMHAPSPRFDRSKTVVVLTVEYPAQLTDTLEGDAMVQGDLDALRRRLFDGAYWNRTTSLIISISGPAAGLGAARIDRNEKGVRARLTLTLDYYGAGDAV